MQKQRYFILLFSISMLILLIVYGISSPTLFQGKVLSAKGEPVEGASIRINHTDEIIALTQKSGMFEFQTDKLVFSLEARSSLYPTYRAIWFPEHNQEEFALLVLKKPFDFQGRISDKNNKPIPAAKLQIYSSGYFSPTGFSLIATITADAEGKFVIKDLVPDNQYQVEVSADNYQTWKTDTLSAGRNRLPELAWIKLDSNIRYSSVSDIRPTSTARVAGPDTRSTPSPRVPDDSYWRSRAQQTGDYPAQMPRTKRIPNASSISSVPRSTANPNFIAEIISGDSSKTQVTVAVIDLDGKPVPGTKVIIAGKTMVTDTAGRIEFTPEKRGEININVNYQNVWHSRSYYISHKTDTIRIRVGTINKTNPEYVPPASTIKSDPGIKYDPTNGTTSLVGHGLWRRQT
ncbi:MAG: carboxypeptidase-like regulatory domain-containing protein [bacterium]